MAAARIVNGRWTRNVPWRTGANWRTDIFKTVLADQHLLEAEFILRDGPIVVIPATELRRLLSEGRDRYNGRICGPFNVDPVNRTIDGQPCQMVVRERGEIARQDVSPNAEEPDPSPGFDAEEHRKGWSSGEGAWHRSTVEIIASAPELVGVIPAQVRRRWVNSCVSDDSKKLWRRLRSQKRPDIVFELLSGDLVIIEVEPFTTYLDGLAQLRGDYLIAAEVDRQALELGVYVKGLFVVDRDVDRVKAEARMLLGDDEIQVVTLP